jgi:hypothetical protein
MDKYVKQLLDDITHATENVDWPFIRKESYDIWEIPFPEEEIPTTMGLKKMRMNGNDFRM